MGDNSTFRAALRKTIDRVLDVALPKPARKSSPKADPQAALSRSLQATHAAAEQHIAAEQRSAPFEAPTIPGTGRQWHVSNLKEYTDLGQQRLLATKEARRGRVFSTTGPSPQSQEYTPEFTLGHIAKVRNQAQRSGWLLEKADLDSRLLREDYQLQQCDRSRRAAIYKARHVLAPKDSSKLSYLVCNAVQGVIDEIDSFDSGIASLGVANGSGVAMADIAYKPLKLRVVVGKNHSIVVDSEGVEGLYPVPNRSLVYDLDTEDAPYVLQGAYNPVNPLYLPGDPDEGIPDEPLRKVLYHRAYGDGMPRMRGYQWAAHTLCYLKTLTVERLGILVEQFALPTPYLQEPVEGNVTDEDRNSAYGGLESIGKGEPTSIPSQYGEIKFTPTPASFTPVHSMAISIIDAALSKLITSQTLAMESNGVGSFALGSVHADQQEDCQAIDLRLVSQTERTQLIRYILDFNADVWARSFAPYCPGEDCSPDAIRACLPRAKWTLNRKVDPVARLKMFLDGKAGGLLISADQVYEECDFARAGDKSTAFGGEAAVPDAEPEAAPEAAPQAPPIPAEEAT